MSSQVNSCLASAHNGIDSAESQLFGSEGRTLPQPVTESEEHPGTEEDAVMADNSDPTEGRVSTQGSVNSKSDDGGDSGGDGESDDGYDDVEDADSEDGDGDSDDDGEDSDGDGDCDGDDSECSNAKHFYKENCREEHCHKEHSANKQCHGVHCSEYHCHNEPCDDDCCNEDHSDDKRCGEEDCHKGHGEDEHNYHKHCKKEHHHKKSDQGRIYVNEWQKYMGTRKPAAGIHECRGHYYDQSRAKRRVDRFLDGRELFVVVLAVRFDDALIDHSRSYGSKFYISGGRQNSALPEPLDFQRAQTFLEVEFADLAAHVHPPNRPVTLVKRRSTLRYTVKFEFITSQIGIPKMPCKEFMSFGKVPISGEEALRLIARMDEIIFDAIELIDEVVASKDTANYKLRNALCDRGIEHPTSPKEPSKAIQGSTVGRDDGSGTGNIIDGIRYLNFGVGQPLFSVHFDICFTQAQKNNSRNFQSNSKRSKEPNATSELCDLDFKHLQRLINISLISMVNNATYENEKDLTAEERKEHIRCAIRVDFSTGPSWSLRKRYIFYAASPLSRGTEMAIQDASESLILTAIKTMDAISAQREIARFDPEYDPCAFIPDFEARRAFVRQERNELEADRLRMMVTDAYEHLPVPGEHPRRR